MIFIVAVKEFFVVRADGFTLLLVCPADSPEKMEWILAKQNFRFVWVGSIQVLYQNWVALFRTWVANK